MLISLLSMLAGCTPGRMNDPYPASERGSNTLYLGFVERPSHLDPAQAYSEDAYEILEQIVVPPLQYSYLKRPYILEPALLDRMPLVTRLDTSGKPLPADAPLAQVAETDYELHVRPGTFYQPHPAFVRRADGRLRYVPMSVDEWSHLRRWQDFRQTATREVVAADLAHEIRRLASPQVNSPVLQLMGEHIIGLQALADRLQHDAGRMGQDQYLDLDRYPLSGVEVVDRYTLRIRLKGVYPQFRYWLAMPFFAPVPAEVDAFYHQPGMQAHDFSLDWHPVGSGPYMLTLMEPNRRIELTRNPLFHGERYPAEGEPGDRAAGLLSEAGQSLPLIDHVVFSREKEVIPYWNKFLQGYYDLSAISSDNFDEAVRVNAAGQTEVAPAMRRRGIRLVKAVLPTIQYVGFNMLDPVVGGTGERSRKLRQAIAIAVNYEDFIAIFLNGRGQIAQDPLPPGIFGHQDGVQGVDPVVYQVRNGHVVRKPISAALQLMRDAGYVDGRDVQTGRPLVLYYDNTFTGPNAKAYVDWMVQQLARIHVQLVPRSMDFNHFQDNLQHGNVQMFVGGWNADYPDPENFFALFYGPNGKVVSHGENDTNYHNPQFDALFERMKYMDDTPERARIIAQMNGILQQDVPWLFGFYPLEYELEQPWVGPRKISTMNQGTIKYLSLDIAMRQRMRDHNNRPALWPLAGLAGLLVFLSLLQLLRHLQRKQRKSSRDDA